MATVFSIPTYPNATQYNVQYSDPTVGDPNGPNKFGPWVNLGSGSVTNPSNIIDAAASTDARLYRVQPVALINSTSIPTKWYDPFTPNTLFYDANITALLPSFRDRIGDYGTTQVTSTNINFDTGAGSGLLVFDGIRKTFNLADIPDAESATIAEGSVRVVKNGLTLLGNTDYVVDYDAGQITFLTAPAITDTCDITFVQVIYTNRMLNAALADGVDSLAQLGLNGFSTRFDNSVRTSVVLPNGGLQSLVLSLAAKSLHRALLTNMGRRARAYRTGDFQMDTAPSRVIDALSHQAQQDWSELRIAANNYIRTATTPISYTTYDKFFDFNGSYPLFDFLVSQLNANAGYSWWM